MINHEDVDKLSILVTTECIGRLVEKSLLSTFAVSATSATTDAFQVILQTVTSTISAFLNSKDVHNSSVKNDSTSTKSHQSIPDSVVDDNCTTSTVEGMDEELEVKDENDPKFDKLSDWCPVFFYDDGNCCMAGNVNILKKPLLYRSNDIREIFEDGRRFRDSDGNFFELYGELNTETYNKIAVIEGVITVSEFPQIFVRSFENGIPLNWRDVIKQTSSEILVLMTKSPETTPLTTETSTKSTESTNTTPRTDSTLKPRNSNTDNNRNSSPATSRLEDKKTRKSEDSFQFDVISSSPFHSSYLSTGRENVQVKVTRNSSNIDLAKVLKRTRSGRLVKPIIDSWRGQSITEANDGRIEVSLGNTSDKIGLRQLGITPPLDDSGYATVKKKVTVKREKSMVTATSKTQSKSPLGHLSFASDEESGDESLVHRLLEKASRSRVDSNERIATEDIKSIASASSFRKKPKKVSVSDFLFHASGSIQLRSISDGIERSKVSKVSCTSPLRFDRSTGVREHKLPTTDILSESHESTICDSTVESITHDVIEHQVLVHQTASRDDSKLPVTKMKKAKKAYYSVDLDEEDF